MATLDIQTEYWNSEGTAKTFGHPVEFAWLDRLDRRARILDYGCGYGRLMAQLTEHGFENVEGADIASNLLDRARERCPGARFTLLSDPPRLGHDDGSVDAALLFTVLTCIPTDDGQRELIAELHRVLRPGGLLYVSDLCLQDDQRNLDRYSHFLDEYGTYGVFETDDGAVCRHHTLDWLHELLADFERVDFGEAPIVTMNGHPGKATQLLVAKR